MKKLLALMLATFVSFSLFAENIDIRGPSGILKTVIERPANTGARKYPCVILMHGFMSNKEFSLLTEMEARLNQNGFVTVRFDFDGHGQSDGRFQDMTVPKEIEDAKAVFDYVRKLDYVGDISLLGHSQGGAVASIVAGDLRGKVKSLVLFAAAAALEYDTRAGFMFGQTYDPANPPEYIEVFGNRVGRDYLVTSQNMRIYERASKYNGDVCIISGIDDSIVRYFYALRYEEIYKNGELHLLAGEDHSFNKKRAEAEDIATAFLVRHGK